MPDQPPQDPLEFVKSMWGSMGFTLPGMVTPTLDVGELDKRIADLKAVEGWLKMNLSMLQMSIQGLEMQRATIATLQALGQSGSSSADGANPMQALSQLSSWPWKLMQASTESPARDEPAEPKEPKRQKRTKPT